MKNILFLHAGAELYGADRVLLELLKGVDKKQYRPIVVLPENGPLVKQLEENEIETLIIPYPILRRKYFNFKGIIRYMLAYKKCSDEIIKLLSNLKIDIIHVNTAAVLEGIYLKKKLRAKLVWHIHEIIQNPKIVYKVTSYLIGKYSDKIVVVSEAVKKHLISSKKVPIEKIQVIYNGVDNKIFNSNNETQYLRNELCMPENALIVGMIGRINALKGQNEFLDALEPLLSQYDNLHAVLIGDVFRGEEWRREEILSRINSNESSQRIHCLLYRNDCPNLHNLFDVFVLPSTKPDSLPTVVLEAMATEKPVVGFAHGGITEMINDGENGYLIEVNNTQKMGEKIQELLNDKERRKIFGQNSIERQKSLFSLESYILNFSKMYSDL